MKLCIALALLFGLAASPSSGAGLLYSLKRTATLPSTNTDWDYIKFEPGTQRLFLARGNDGLTVFDVSQNCAVATVPNSVGANGPLLLPQYNRGYVAMTDGSLLSLTLGTLKPLERRKLATDAGLNSGMHDPATRRVHFITGTRDAGAIWYTLNAATGKEIGRKHFPFRKMDDPAADGLGNLYAPARHDKLILKLDSRTLAEKARWEVGCPVSKVRYRPVIKRIVGACGGDKPEVFVLNPAEGSVTARVRIGRGMDALVVDEQRQRLVTANGTDGTLTVIEMRGPDDISLLGTVSTQVGARMMDIDPRTGSLHLVTARLTTLAPVDGAGPVEHYHPDSFAVFAFQPD